MWGNSDNGLFGSDFGWGTPHFIHFPNEQQEKELKKKLKENYDKVYKK